MAKFFQIWSTIAGSDELCVGFYPIRNGEIFWMNNKVYFNKPTENNNTKWFNRERSLLKRLRQFCVKCVLGFSVKKVHISYQPFLCLLRHFLDLCFQNCFFRRTTRRSAASLSNWACLRTKNHLPKLNFGNLTFCRANKTKHFVLLPYHAAPSLCIPQ